MNADFPFENYEYEYNYKEYPFLNVPKIPCSDRTGKRYKLEYEVTDYSISVIRECYDLYKGEKYEIEPIKNRRRQMSTMGAYLRNKEDCGIDIVADILTSFKNLQINGVEDYIFSRIYHSVGNIIPVCEGINTRWGQPDLADRKLDIIKDHLGIKDFDEDLLKTVHDKIEKGEYLGTGISDRDCLKYWVKNDLSGMEWDRFVKLNYLHDFVDDTNKVIEPSEMKDINDMIIKRGYRIFHEGIDIPKEVMRKIREDFETEFNVYCKINKSLRMRSRL